MLYSTVLSFQLLFGLFGVVQLAIVGQAAQGTTSAAPPPPELCTALIFHNRAAANAIAPAEQAKLCETASNVSLNQFYNAIQQYAASQNNRNVQNAVQSLIADIKNHLAYLQSQVNQNAQGLSNPDAQAIAPQVISVLFDNNLTPLQKTMQIVGDTPSDDAQLQALSLIGEVTYLLASNGI